MSEKKKLFDKSMEELREAFVRARFAEREVFGRPDVEEWLAEQRTAERPDDSWEQLLHKLNKWADTDWFDFRSHATSLGVLNERIKSLGEANDYGPIYDCLAFNFSQSGRQHELFDGNDGLVYVGDHIYGPRFVIEERENDCLTIKRIRNLRAASNAKAIIGVVFAEWDRKRHKKELARHSICETFNDVVKDERTNAEADFDRAVAVSADGTQITCADYVVVIVERGNRLRHLIVYPATVFQKKKLIRSPEIQRINPYNLTDDGTTLDDIEAINESLDASHDWASDEWRRRLGDIVPFEYISIQELRSYRKDKEQRILLATPNFCPSPLPDGGVELK